MSIGDRCTGCTWVLTADNTNWTGSPPACLAYQGHVGQPLCKECGEQVLQSLRSKTKLVLVKKNVLDQKFPGSITEKEGGKIIEITGHVFVPREKALALYHKPDGPEIWLAPGGCISLI